MLPAHACLLDTRFTASKKVNDLKTIARTIFDAADAGGKRVPARLQDTFNARMADVAQPADVVEQRVEELRGQLEVSQQINPGVVKRYEELKASVRQFIVINLAPLADFQRCHSGRPLARSSQ
jgi:hypothetical protein